jgi:hypothetical protein
MTDEERELLENGPARNAVAEPAETRPGNGRPFSLRILTNRLRGTSG